MRLLVSEKELISFSCRDLVPLECEICKNVFYKTKNTVLRGLKGTRQVSACGKKCRNKLVSQSLKTYYTSPIKNKNLRHNILKKELVNLLGGKCIICGYDKCLSSLTFHHKNPSEKSFAISRALCKKRSKEELIEEVKKCVLLCSNCHNEIHEGLITLC
jgi:5-methylcytosine-specific restriction endonuclease McrA